MALSKLAPQVLAVRGCSVGHPGSLPLSGPTPSGDYGAGDHRVEGYRAGVYNAIHQLRLCQTEYFQKNEIPPRTAA